MTSINRHNPYHSTGTSNSNLSSQTASNLIKSQSEENVLKEYLTILTQKEGTFSPEVHLAFKDFLQEKLGQTSQADHPNIPDLQLTMFSKNSYTPKIQLLAQTLIELKTHPESHSNKELINLLNSHLFLALADASVLAVQIFSKIPGAAESGLKIANEIAPLASGAAQASCVLGVAATVLQVISLSSQIKKTLTAQKELKDLNRQIDDLNIFTYRHEVADSLVELLKLIILSGSVDLPSSTGIASIAKNYYENLNKADKEKLSKLSAQEIAGKIQADLKINPIAKRLSNLQRINLEEIDKLEEFSPTEKNILRCISEENIGINSNDLATKYDAFILGKRNYTHSISQRASKTQGTILDHVRFQDGFSTEKSTFAKISASCVIAVSMMLRPLKITNLIKKEAAIRLNIEFPSGPQWDRISAETYDTLLNDLQNNPNTLDDNKRLDDVLAKFAENAANDFLNAQFIDGKFHHVKNTRLHIDSEEKINPDLVSPNETPLLNKQNEAEKNRNQQITKTVLSAGATAASIAALAILFSNPAGAAAAAIGFTVFGLMCNSANFGIDVNNIINKNKQKQKINSPRAAMEALTKFQSGEKKDQRSIAHDLLIYVENSIHSSGPLKGEIPESLLRSLPLLNSALAFNSFGESAKLYPSAIHAGKSYEKEMETLSHAGTAITQQLKEKKSISPEKIDSLVQLATESSYLGALTIFEEVFIALKEHNQDHEITPRYLEQEKKILLASEIIIKMHELKLNLGLLDAEKIGKLFHATNNLDLLLKSSKENRDSIACHNPSVFESASSFFLPNASPSQEELNNFKKEEKKLSAEKEWKENLDLLCTEATDVAQNVLKTEAVTHFLNVVEFTLLATNL